MESTYKPKMEKKLEEYRMKIAAGENITAILRDAERQLESILALGKKDEYAYNWVAIYAKELQTNALERQRILAARIEHWMPYEEKTRITTEEREIDEITRDCKKTEKEAITKLEERLG